MISVGFETALAGLKAGAFEGWRRRAWKPGKWVWLKPATSKSMSYLELQYSDGRAAPWCGTRCDLLENDWEATALPSKEENPRG